MAGDGVIRRVAGGTGKRTILPTHTDSGKPARRRLEISQIHAVLFTTIEGRNERRDADKPLILGADGFAPLA